MKFSVGDRVRHRGGGTGEVHDVLPHGYRVRHDNPEMGIVTWFSENCEPAKSEPSPPKFRVGQTVLGKGTSVPFVITKAAFRGGRWAYSPGPWAEESLTLVTPAHCEENTPKTEDDAKPSVKPWRGLDEDDLETVREFVGNVRGVMRRLKVTCDAPPSVVAEEMRAMADMLDGLGEVQKIIDRFDMPF